MPGPVIGEGVIAIDIDDSGYQAGVNRTPEAARKAAELAAKEIAKIGKAAEVAAAKGSAEFKAGFAKVTSAAAAMAGGVGGSFGKIGGLANSAIKPILEVAAGAGGAGVAIAGLVAAAAAGPAALAGLAYGVFSVANAAGDAADRLEKVGQLVGDSGAIGEYGRAVSALGITMDQLTVAIGDGVGHELAVLTTEIGLSVKAIGEHGAAVVAWGVELGNILSFQLAPLVHGLEVDLYRAMTATAESTVAMNTQLAIQDANMRLVAASTAALTDNLEELAKQDELEGARQQGLADKRAAASKAAAAAEVKAQHDMAAAVDAGNAQLIADGKARTAAFAADMKAHADALDQQLDFADGQKELRDLAEEAEAAGEAIENIITEAKAKRLRERIKTVTVTALQLAQDLTGAVSTVFDSIAETNSVAMDQVIDDSERVGARQEDIYGKMMDLREQARNAETQEERDRAEALIAQYEMEQEFNKGVISADNNAHVILAANQEKLFRANRASAIGQAIIGASLSIIQCFAQLGPIAGAIAAIGVGTATGAEIYAIANQPVPEFPMGRSADHPIAAFLQRGEPVINKNGNALLEQALGAGAADRLNAGIAPGAGGTSIVLGRRIIAEIVGGSRQRVADPRNGKGRGRRRG